MFTCSVLLIVATGVTIVESFKVVEFPNPPPRTRITLDQLPRPYATTSARKGPNVIAEPADAKLRVPQGFNVTVLAKGLDMPRWLQLTPEGDILLAESRRDRIKLLRYDNGTITSIMTFADAANNGMYIPFGMAFIPKNDSTDEYYLYIGNTNAVMRFNYTIGDPKLIGKGTKIYDLPGGGYHQHWTRNVIAHPDGQHLYVSIGSRSNVGVEPAPRASVIKMSHDGTNAEIFGSGLRNPVGLATHPLTGDLYTTVNERDDLGDDLVPDYFTRVEKGDFYGWPYTYLAKNLIDPRIPRNTTIEGRTKTPDVLLQAHSAALGVQFYKNQSSGFPRRYNNGAFVAFRGSWNRNAGTGYKIVFIPFHPATNRPFGFYEDFVDGFLADPRGPHTWGRPVGVLVLGDGSLIFTDETGGRLYRVSYISEE